MRDAVATRDAARAAKKGLRVDPGSRHACPACSATAKKIRQCLHQPGDERR